MNWVPLSKEISGNFVSDLDIYNNKLIACGWFNTTGTSTAQSIAAWDGSNWTTFGGVRNNNSLYKSITFNNELYVGGYFDSIGNINAKNIAKWDGTTWHSLSTGSDGSVYSLAVYNNELYAGGTFSVIGGITGNCIGRWDGTSWHPLGIGMQNNVNDLFVYNNELYAVGTFYSAGGNSNCKYLSRWNGSIWNNVISGVPYGNAALIEWNGKLIIGSNNDMNPPYTDNEIWQWDGVNLTLFSKQPSVSVRKFFVFNNELYCSGGGGPDPNGGSLVSKWDSSSSLWISVGTGPNYYVTALEEFNGELYCAGSFNTLAYSNLNHIGRLTNVTGVKSLKNKEQLISFSPNPISDKLKINWDDKKIYLKNISVSNMLGKKVFEIVNPILNNDLDLSLLSNGVYFLCIQSEVQTQVFKIVKE